MPLAMRPGDDRDSSAATGAAASYTRPAFATPYGAQHAIPVAHSVAHYGTAAVTTAAHHPVTMPTPEYDSAPLGYAQDSSFTDYMVSAPSTSLTYPTSPSHDRFAAWQPPTPESVAMYDDPDSEEIGEVYPNSFHAPVYVHPHPTTLEAYLAQRPSNDSAPRWAYAYYGSTYSSM